MQSRCTKSKQLRSQKRRGSQFTLETLDQRVLLSVSTDLPAAAGDNLYAAAMQSGYAAPDLFFSDPFFWDLSAHEVGPSTLLANEKNVYDLLEEMENNLLSDYYSGLNTLFGDTATDGNSVSNDLSEEPETATSPYTLYLDFDGERVNSRIGDFWLGSSYVDIPAYDLSNYGWGGREQESINYILNFVQEDYAAYNINVTTTKPTTGEYTTLYVGGDDTWFRPDSGVIGVATYDVGNKWATNYGFAFSEELDIYCTYSYGDLMKFSEYLANLITHEAAHTYGANHVQNTTALMNPYLPINPRTSMFGQGTVPNSSAYQDTQSLLGTNIGYAHGEDDYGNTMQSAWPIQENSIVSGLLERRDDVDAFRFTASAGGTVTIDVNTTPFGNLDSVLTVYQNSTSSVIQTNDNDSGGKDSLLQFEAIAGQCYTIYVSSSGSSSSGSYSFTLTAAEPEPIWQPSDHITVSSWSPTVLELNPFGDQSQNSYISQPLEKDLYKLSVNTSGSIAFSLETANLDGYVALYDTDGNLVNWDYNSGYGDIVYFSDSVEALDSYYILVGSFGEETSGSYTLNVNAETINTSNLNIDILGTGHTSGSLASGKTGYWQITVPKDALGDLTLDVTGTGLDTVLNVYDIQGNLLGRSNTSGLSGTESLTIHNCAEGQVYYLRIGSANLTGSGTYTVHAGFAMPEPEPKLSITDSVGSPTDKTIHFGSILAGSNGTATLTLANTGRADLIISELIGSGVFTLSRSSLAGSNADDIVIAPGCEEVITVTFDPEEIGSYVGQITVVSNDSDLPTTYLSLQATARGGILQITELDGQNDGEIHAGIIQTGQTTPISAWQLHNSGNLPITITLNMLSGIDFSLSGNEIFVLQPGQSYTVVVDIHTQLAREITDSLTLTANDLNATSQTLNFDAQAFALIGGGQSYRFIDHSGDQVTLSLSGDALAKVTIGQPHEPDIRSIEILTATGTEKLSINVKGAGSTMLGEITGAANLNKILAKKVDLVGMGIDLEGSLNQLRIGSVLNGADIRFTCTQPAVIKTNEVIGDSTITIDGQVKLFRATDFRGGSLTGKGIAKLVVEEECDAVIEAGETNIDSLLVRNGDLRGTIFAAGSIGKISLANGNLSGEVAANYYIDQVKVKKGTLEGSLYSESQIGKISAGNIQDAAITAIQGIDTINVRGNLNNTVVSIGYTNLAHSQNPAVPAREIDAYLGRLKVKGTFAATTIAVGVAPDEQGSFLAGTAANASGTIGKVVLQQVNTNSSDDPFGLFAQNAMQKLKVEKQKITPDYHHDNFYIEVLNQ